MDDSLHVAITLEQFWHRVPGGTAVAIWELTRALDERHLAGPAELRQPLLQRPASEAARAAIAVIGMSFGANSGYAINPARDLGPRIITVTHHNAVIGPYHRNGGDILDIQHSFRATDPEVAHEVMRRHGASLLLICPGLSESTVYGSEAPKGFYVQLVKGQVPGWLAPMPLPKDSPYRLWRRID